MSTIVTPQVEPEVLKSRIARFREVDSEIVHQVRRVIVGQDEVIEQVRIGLFVGGHCLITGLPGTAKTLLVRTMAEVLGLVFKRIQFTPDLMPTDITGTDIIEEDPTTGHRTWTFVQGPIFANVLLADEINRTPPKTQSALLEAMQERACTVRGHHYMLPAPFFVLATQNPIELEGTYPLPEAQLDRFLFNILLDYLTAEQELQVVDLTTTTHVAKADPITTAEEIARLPATGAHDADRGDGGEVCHRTGARHAREGSFGAGRREEVCELRRQRARGAIPCVGGQSPGADERPVSRELRRCAGAVYSDPAPSDSAEFPCGIGSADPGRYSEADAADQTSPEGLRLRNTVLTARLDCPAEPRP